MRYQKYSEPFRGVAFSCRVFSFVIALGLCLGYGPALSENPPARAPKAPDMIAYLTETINWYHGAVAEQQMANETSDLPFLNDNRRISSQILRLAFDFARAEEEKESKQPKGGQSQEQTNVPSQYQRLTQATANADLQVEQTKNELQSLRKELAGIPGKKRPALESRIAEKQSELALRQAHRDALHKMIEFATVGWGTLSKDFKLLFPLPSLWPSQWQTCLLPPALQSQP